MSEKLYAIAVSQSLTENIIWKFCTTPVPQETKDKFPFKIQIVWRFTENSGMPRSELLEKMMELEDACRELSGEFSVAKTGGNRRELIFYTDDPDSFKTLCGEYPVEFKSEEDKNWEAHEQTLALFENAPKAKPKKFRPKRIKTWKKR